MPHLRRTALPGLYLASQLTRAARQSAAEHFARHWVRCGSWLAEECTDLVSRSETTTLLLLRLSRLVVGFEDVLFRWRRDFLRGWARFWNGLRRAATFCRRRARRRNHRGQCRHGSRRIGGTVDTV